MRTMETTAHREQLTLVLGGTGKTGRRVAERLIARGIPLQLGSRSGKPPFDWEDQTTWVPALRDVKSVYLVYYPDLAMPGAVAAIRAFVDLAVQRGVQHLVLLSGRGEDEAQRCEQVVQESGVQWTILRASWFSQNFSESFMRDLVLGGEVALPVGNVVEPFVDAEDIADVAVAALTEEGHASQLYELTGPRLLTFAEAVGEIARTTSQEIRYVPISPEEFATALADQQVPREVRDLLNYLFTTVLDGRNAHLTDGVQRALGRKPRDFAEYVRDAAASGAWRG
jgi:uncharacterized protein YbjT (DUF2867 family)